MDGASRVDAISRANAAHDELIDSRCRLSSPMECSMLCRDIWFLVHLYVEIMPSGLDIFQMVSIAQIQGNGSQIECD